MTESVMTMTTINTDNNDDEFPCHVYELLLYDDERFTNATTNWHLNPPQHCLLGEMWLAVPENTESITECSRLSRKISEYHGGSRIITAYHSLAYHARCGYLCLFGLLQMICSRHFDAPDVLLWGLQMRLSRYLDILLFYPFFPF